MLDSPSHDAAPLMEAPVMDVQIQPKIEAKIEEHAEEQVTPPLDRPLQAR